MQQTVPGRAWNAAFSSTLRGVLFTVLTSGKRNNNAARVYPGKALYREKQEKHEGSNDGGVLKVQPQSYAIGS
jgi:hypothetical protein